MRNRIQQMSIALIALSFILTVTAGAEAPVRQAILLKVEGTAEVRIAQADWKPAEAGMILHASDEIRTGKNSTAEVLLDEGGSSGEFELKPESRLQFNKMDGDAKTAHKVTVLNLAIGDVLVHAQKVTGDSVFQVKTPNSTTGVRGTTFLVSAEPKNE